MPEKRWRDKRVDKREHRLVCRSLILATVLLEWVKTQKQGCWKGRLWRATPNVGFGKDRHWLIVV